MNKPTALYVATAILFVVCVVVNFLSMLKQTNDAEEILHRSKRDVEDAFINAALVEHNKLRAKHGSPPLVVDKSLCAETVVWALKLARDSDKAGKITMTHSKTADVGENIGVCKCSAWTAKKITDAWYDEIKQYNWSNNIFNYKTGHFTQLVWKETKRFCIARDTEGKFSSVVAHYSPRGNANYRSSFAANVFPPK